MFDMLSPEIRPAVPAISLAGHRDRMRSRLISAGAEAVADYELFEMILFLALPRCDTKAIARSLKAKFGSFAATISASVLDLLSVEGLSEAGGGGC